MTVVVVNLTPVKSGNPSGNLLLTFVERSSFIGVGVLRTRTTVSRHYYVVVAIVHDDIHSSYVRLPPFFQTKCFNVFLALQYLINLFLPVLFHSRTKQ